MTKDEILQKFKRSIDMIDLEGNFPDIDFVVTELEDGQQEIIIRLQGEDSDFRPGGDYDAISAFKLTDFRRPVVPEAGADDSAYITACGDIEVLRADFFPGVAINTSTLRRGQDRKKRNRRKRFEKAIFKRVKALIVPAGISVRRMIKILQNNLPVQEDDV